MNRLLTSLLLLSALSGCTRPNKDLDCLGQNAPKGDGPPALKLLSVDLERSEMAWGNLLMNQSDKDESWVTVTNGCAEHIWWKKPSDVGNRIFRAHLSRDGERIQYAEHRSDHSVDAGRLFELDMTTDRVVQETSMPESHHDFAELDGGEVAWISWDYLENEWFPNLEADVVTDVVRTATMGETAVTDNRVMALKDVIEEPWWTCSHMTPSDRIPGYAEWSHSNSLMWEPTTDRLFLFARYWDALIAFERTGEVAWVMGGPKSDFEIASGTEFMTHSHLSELWDGGMLVFDNRNHHKSGTSRVVEFAWDEDTMTVEEVWSYEDDTFVSFLGDARRRGDLRRRHRSCHLSPDAVGGGVGRTCRDRRSCGARCRPRG